jgi:hypothetical protein
MSQGGDGTVRADVDRYTLAEEGLLADLGSVPAGTSILVLGSSILGASDCVWDLLEHGLAVGQPGMLVTTAHVHADRVGEGLLCVDCSGTPDEESTGSTRIERVGSPSDLTGIGIGWVKCARAIGDGATGGLRVGLLSISTLLQYVDADRVFNFLHILTGRISAAGYLGVFTLDPAIHEDATVNQIKAQFDGVVMLEESDEEGGVTATFEGRASRR